MKKLPICKPHHLCTPKDLIRLFEPPQQSLFFGTLTLKATLKSPPSGFPPLSCMFCVLNYD